MDEAMIQRVEDFAGWRAMARVQLLRKTPPAALIWRPVDDDQQVLFSADPSSGVIEAENSGTDTREQLKLPRAFVEIARTVARHRNPDRWSLLYRIAWRILNEQPHLLAIESDDDVRALALMRKAVDRDAYKMRAFVRFRRIVDNGREQFVAWYRPDHHTLDLNERFFVDRFGAMHWAILTPERSMLWNLEKIQYAPGVPRSEAPQDDEFEELWRTYYRSVYNPARLNLNAMRAELPVRRWLDLPESRVIPELVRISRGQVQAMKQPTFNAASGFIPSGADFATLREAVRKCAACELCGRATQAVFGESPSTEPSAIRIMLVGEQPGDEEDCAGKPFIGPAGQVLDQAMRAAGIERSAVYLTNAVKAFHFEERGKRRIHQTPRSVHIATCRPWLEAEIEAFQPERILCLGATAAQSVLGRVVRIRSERGLVAQHRWPAQVIVTYHPSAILRAPDGVTKEELKLALVEDLGRSLKPAF